MTLQTQKVVDLQVDPLSEILLESKSNGFNAISRLITDWTSGSNRFDRLGEALFKVSCAPDFHNKILSTVKSGLEAQNLLKFCPNY